jgi:hypothetical protein
MKILVIGYLLLLLLIMGCGTFRSMDRCSGCGGTGRDTYMTSDYSIHSRVCPICLGTGKERK